MPASQSRLTVAPRIAPRNEPIAGVVISCAPHAKLPYSVSSGNSVLK